MEFMNPFWVFLRILAKAKNIALALTNVPACLAIQIRTLEDAVGESGVSGWKGSVAD